jgi:ABC-type dipeptide/oligopeptide/nickel transport system permease subunit
VTSVVDSFAAEPMSVEPDAGPGSPVQRKIQGRSPWRLAWERLRRDKLAMASLAVIVLLVLFAVGAPVVAAVTGHPVDEQYRDTGLTEDGVPVGPNSTFWLGTDNLGRDLLVRIAYGARVSLFIGIFATLLALIIPFLVTAIALIAIFQPSIKITIAVILFFMWAPVARIVRGQVLSLREKEFIEAARSIGSADLRVMFVDVVPNLIGPLIVYGTLLIPQVIVLEATLAFLGLGDPGQASWGGILAEVQNGSLYTIAWWMLVFPALALLITTLAFNLLGDGLRDAFDPGSDRTLAK